jgi:hypothetical protein
MVISFVVDSELERADRLERRKSAQQRKEQEIRGAKQDLFRPRRPSFQRVAVNAGEQWHAANSERVSPFNFANQYFFHSAGLALTALLAETRNCPTKFALGFLPRMLGFQRLQVQPVQIILAAPQFLDLIQALILERLEVEAWHVMDEVAENRAVSPNIISHHWHTAGERLANHNAPAFIVTRHEKELAALQKLEFFLFGDIAGKVDLVANPNASTCGASVFSRCQ